MLGDVGLIGLLKSKMKWFEARQSVLAQNISHADTPGYQPFDLEPIPGTERQGATRVALAATNAGHMGPVGGIGLLGLRANETESWEATPRGNAVVLAEEILKVATNQFEFQLVSSLYSRSLGLIKTAVGRA
jgi:flagellar basal-body rod protein FlgB